MNKCKLIYLLGMRRSKIILFKNAVNEGLITIIPKPFMKVFMKSYLGNFRKKAKIIEYLKRKQMKYRHRHK